MPDYISNLAYIVAILLFVFGIKGMTHPRTAVRGNLMSAVAMLIAVVFTLPAVSGIGWAWVIAGVLVGGAIGAFLAQWVQMTGMPQMVAIFNGLGGGASVFVAWAELIHNTGETQVARGSVIEVIPLEPGLTMLIATAAAGLIGAVTLSGSLIAFGKLQEFKIFWKPWVIPGQQLINAGLFALSLILCVLVVTMPDQAWIWYTLLVIVATVLGVTLTGPIGGADMPVVIALLNSYSGLAAAAAGFVIGSQDTDHRSVGNILIVAGSLVGASGLILTAIMCKAMNRSLTNVIFGKIDAASGPSADDVYEGKIKATSADEIAMMLDGAQRVVIVPGYGMAVAQAQGAVRNLFNELEKREITVEFAIHPVAGRMPGHMNVLLAEVDIPYDKLIESDMINATMETVDMAIVLGANDVVNPVAREPKSAIAGMPIVDVDKARTVVVIKRSLSPGFAGIPNPLFAMDNTLMFFNDGRDAVEEIIAAVKEN